MLVLSFKVDDDAVIDLNGKKVIVRVCRMDKYGQRVHLGFDAPDEVQIIRKSLLDRERGL